MPSLVHADFRASAQPADPYCAVGHGGSFFHRDGTRPGPVPAEVTR